MNESTANNGMSPAVALMRRYVMDYINRHDFSVIKEFMADDYTLHTGDVDVIGRDGDYRAAVAKQLDQFPGLVFTLHDIFQSGDRLGVRFTEHGASIRHGGRRAAWSSIAIYAVRDGRLASCTIEQDYFSRRRQLDTGEPVAVDRPTIAPWDTVARTPNETAELAVRRWLDDGAFLTDGVAQIDDSLATGLIEQIVTSPRVEVLDILSGGDQVAFHAVQRGELAPDFGRDLAPQVGMPVSIHLSGLVSVDGDTVTAGNVIRDRWGLYRRLSPRR